MTGIPEEISSFQQYELAVEGTELTRLDPKTPSLDPVLPHGAKLCAMGMLLPDDLTEGAWLSIGRKLLSIDGSLKFALGDWWAFGHHEYGDRAKAAEELDYKFESLMNLGWVSRKVPTSLRNEALTFTHHKAVAKLGHAEQKDWLDRAVDNDWSAKTLAKEIKDYENERGPADEEELKRKDPVAHRKIQSRKTAVNAIYEFDKVAKSNFFLETYLNKIANDDRLIADLTDELIKKLIKAATPHAKLYNNLIEALTDDQARRSTAKAEADDLEVDSPPNKKKKRERLSVDH